jgi:hypothetical protein
MRTKGKKFMNDPTKRGVRVGDGANPQIDGRMLWLN